eukprot:6173692-Pleurochrysis_carterae.AAC.3
MARPVCRWTPTPQVVSCSARPGLGLARLARLVRALDAAPSEAVISRYECFGAANALGQFA